MNRLKPIQSFFNVRSYSTISQEYDVVVIGSGPGGYVSAIRAAQHGLKTACIEKRSTLGGTCLNVGCIPSKALLHNSQLYEQASKDFPSRGIDIPSSPQLNLGRLMKYKENTVSQLTKGIEFLFKKNKVDWIKGTGSITNNDTIFIKDPNTGANLGSVKSKNIIIATGSTSVDLPGVKINETNIVTSTGALSFSKVPERLLVIGGGVIGLELSSVWSRLGSKVTVVEFMDSIGAGMDLSTASIFQKILIKQGISFKLGSKVTKVLQSSSSFLDIHIQTGEKSEELQADAVLVSVGRRPYTDDLGISSKLDLDAKGRIIVDKQFRTSVQNIYAIGDVIAGPMLAHKAEEEGIFVADLISGKSAHSTHEPVIPSVIYTHPEVAWAGLTEEQLKTAHISYKPGSFPFLANSRAKVINDFEGNIKLLVSSEEKILGCHIIGPNASEMIGEVVLAMQNALPISKLAHTCHAHPTLSEALKEAALTFTQPTFKSIHF